jgi:hypothetical protein
MPNDRRINVKFDPAQIKPLDGSPMMSANCWNAVLETFAARREGRKDALSRMGRGQQHREPRAERQGRRRRLRAGLDRA